MERTILNTKLEKIAFWLDIPIDTSVLSQEEIEGTLTILHDKLKYDWLLTSKGSIIS